MKELTDIPTLDDLELDGVRAVVFDMDGTLLNSEILHTRALKHFVPRPSNTSKKLIEQLTGVCELEAYEKLLSHQMIPKLSYSEFIDLKNEKFSEYLNDESVLKTMVHENLLELIKNLKKEKYLVALVTASEKSTTELFFNKLGLNEYFDLILSRGDAEKSKPDPLPYLNCFEKLSVNANESIVFEDSKTGIKAASSAGAHVIKANWYR